MSEVAGRVFAWGTLLSCVLIAIGLGYAVVAGSSEKAPGLSLSRLLRDLYGLQPSGLIGLGIVGLLLTPSAVLLVMCPLLLRAQDRRFAAITLVVLGIMVVTVALAVR